MITMETKNDEQREKRKTQDKNSHKAINNIIA